MTRFYRQLYQVTPGPLSIVVDEESMMTKPIVSRGLEHIESRAVL